MEPQLHLPWDNAGLEALLLQIINRGETTKVDFKRQLDIATSDHHSELLKDISAMANSYAYEYANHGFLVLGVTGTALTYTGFGQNADALQARVDELLKTYIEPFIPTQVRVFGEAPNTWGVIVIPPTRTAPHVIVKDICKRSRGDIYVRRGTTTDKALPGDYVRFFRLHLDEHTYDLRQQLDELRRSVSALTARKKEGHPEKRLKKSPKSENAEVAAPVRAPTVASASTTPTDLLSEIDRALAKEEDTVTKALVAEAHKVQKFLQSNSIAWDLNRVTPAGSKPVIEMIENEMQTFLIALGSIVFRDSTGKYDEAVLRSLKVIARKYEAPTSTTFTDFGTDIRLYPLVCALYVIFMGCAASGRFSLLKQVKALSISRRTRYEEPLPIAYALFEVRSAGAVFQTQHPNYPQNRWCDPIATRIETFLRSILKFDEIEEDWRAVFFKGEFLLALTPIDVLDKTTGKPSINQPSSGLFLYYSEAEPVLHHFLREQASNIGKVFDRPLKDILQAFDSSAHRFNSGGCFVNDFGHGTVESAFPKQQPQ